MKYYSRERILLAATKYNSRGPNITRGDHILLAETKYYSRELNITRGNVLITRGTEKLLAGTKYNSRGPNITRGKKYYSRERIITRGNLFITRGNDILLAGEKYWQYMAPEGFRTSPLILHYKCLCYQIINSTKGLLSLVANRHKSAIILSLVILFRFVVTCMNEKWFSSHAARKSVDLQSSV